MEECNNCGQPFEITEHRLAMPGTKEREPIYCPNCNHLVAERTTNGRWGTRKLNDTEIADFLKKKKENEKQ